MNIKLLKKIRKNYEIRYEDNKYIVIDHKTKTAKKCTYMYNLLDATLYNSWLPVEKRYSTIYHRRLMQRSAFNEQNKLYKNLNK